MDGTICELPCACGHELDEHERGVACCVDDCDCIQFEETDPNEWDR